MGREKKGKPLASGKARRKLRRFCLSLPVWIIAAFLVTAWSGGCASPVEGLWPPAPGDKTFRIIVSVDSWHSVIGVWPEGDPGGKDPSLLEEWAYAEKGYYLEGDSGSSGTLRALFWPSAGVVQVTRAGRPWSERTPQPPARTWSFELTEQGYRNLRNHLAGERESAWPHIVERDTEWYIADCSYHAFHHCHHWTARALRSAGLPVWAFYALFKWSLEAQLDRAMKFVPAMDQDGGNGQ